MHCSFTEIFTVIFWSFAAGFVFSLVVFAFLTTKEKWKSRKKFKDDKQAFQDKHRRTRPSDDV